MASHLNSDYTFHRKPRTLPLLRYNRLVFDLSKRSVKILVVLSLLTLFTATINYSKSLSQNSTKLPPDLEKEHKFLKWINRWKERFPQIEADTFKKSDDGEIISSTNPRYTFSDVNMENVKEEISKIIKEDGKYTVVAPDKLQYIDFRAFVSEDKNPATSYVYYFGIRDNKTLKGPLFECKKTNCWFDRAFFLTPDLLYIPEVEEKIYPEQPDRCKTTGVCAYELFLHELDLKGNKRTTFVSSQLLTDFTKIQKTLEDY